MKNNSINGVSDIINIPEEDIKNIVSSKTTNGTTINIDECHPDADKFTVTNNDEECEEDENNSDDAEIDKTVSDVDKLNKLVREIIYDDFNKKLNMKDFIKPSGRDVYLSHIMCNMYEVNSDTINDRFSGKLEVSIIADRSSDNITTINVSNLITCYTKSNVVKTYHISYCVLVWCYLDGYDTNILINFIFNTTTRRFINEFKFNEIDDTPWNLPTTMRHIKKIANKYAGLIKYSNSKFSNGTGKVSIRNMSFNLGKDMNDVVTEFDNEFKDLDSEEEE